MATERPQTRDEARTAVIAAMQENSRKLRQAIASGDKEAEKRYAAEDTRLERQYRNIGILGEIGGGLQAGITGLFTAIPDLLSAGYNAVTGRRIPSLQEKVGAFSGFATEPTSQQGAYPYRIAQGLGSSFLPGTGVKGLMTGGALGAADVAAAEASGGVIPEGVVSGAYALGSLTAAGFKGLRNIAKDRKFNQFIDELPADEANRFKAFMLRGQGSDDPVVAAAIQKLRTNPQYAELLAKLEQGASDAVTKGMAPSAGRLTAEESKVGIIQAVQNKLDGIRESNAGSLFERAKGYGGQNPLVDPKITLSKIDGLIAEYSQKNTPNAKVAETALRKIRDNFASTVPVNPEQAALAAGAPLEMTNKRTIEQVQGILSEFGKKASAGDNLIKDLSISDERRISSAIFGGIKDDIREALKTATGADKVALNLLNTARSRVAKSSQDYNEAVSQGIPAFLHNKTLAEISPEDLYKTYVGLTPSQRGVMRSWVSNTDQEALKLIDRNVYQDFIDKAKTKNAIGNMSVDLEKLSENWNSLGKSEKDALVSSLGTNADEFSQRMKDAAVFSRKMRVTGPGEGKLVEPGTQRDIAAAIGSVAGYQAAKGAELTVDALNAIKKTGLNDEQLMKALLTPEGAQFLREGALSPRSARTLDSLTAMTSSQPSMVAVSAGSRAVPSGEAGQPSMDVYIPEDLIPTEPQQAVPDVYIPSDLVQPMRNEKMYEPSLDSPAGQNRQAIFNSELQRLMQASNAAQQSGNPFAQEQSAADIMAILREAQGAGIPLSIR